MWERRQLRIGWGGKDEAVEEFRKLLKVDPKNVDAASNLSQLLYQSGKYAEAAEALEGPVKASPDMLGLQYELGSAYLKTGQTEKAVVHLRAAAEAQGSNPMMLNNVAYALADNKTDLELARQYAQEALTKLDSRSVDDVAAIDTGTQVTYELSLVWDTLGWVYFQSGDTSRSEGLVRAAWLLGQEGLVGEHLGEIYEKQGRSKDAAHVYELALATESFPIFKMSAAPGPYSGLPVLCRRECQPSGARRDSIPLQEADGKKSRDERNAEATEWGVDEDSARGAYPDAGHQVGQTIQPFRHGGVFDCVCTGQSGVDRICERGGVPGIAN